MLKKNLIQSTFSTRRYALSHGLAREWLDTKQTIGQKCLETLVLCQQS
jgi:hypothetical protein